MPSLFKRPTLLSAARLLTTAVLLIFLLGIAWNSYAFFSSDLPKQDPSRASVSTPEKQRLTTIHAHKNIEDWNIFGSYQKENAQRHENIRESKASISLLGTFFNQKGNRSSAIITLNDDGPTLFSISSKISSNIILKDITSQSIIIDNNGIMERVSLSEFNSVSGIDDNKLPQQNSEAEEVAEQDGAAKTARERALEKYGLEPVSKNSASGYRITEDAKEIIEKFNLKPGDTILSVNGYPVGEDGSDTLAIKSFQESGSASVVINQSGSTITMEYKR